MRSPLTSTASLGRGFRALHNRNYRLFWFGQLVSLAGTWMQDVALSWLVLSLTESPVALGLTMTIRFLPALLFSAFGGVLADRLPKRRTLIVAQFLLALIALATAVLISTDLITVGLIYLLAGIRGLVECVDGPTRQAFVSEMVESHDLPNAVALNSTLFSAARIAGPAIGAVVISTFGIAACFYLNAVSFLGVIVALFAMRVSELFIVRRQDDSSGKGLNKVREGFRYARTAPPVLVILLSTAVLGTFGFSFQTSLPLIARYMLSGDASTLAILMIAMGAGSVVAGLTAAYRGRPSQRLLLLAGASFGVLLFVVGLSHSLWSTTLLMFFLGVASILFLTSANTRLQLLAPDHLRGRLLGIYVMFFIGTMPLGSYLTGQLAEALGVQLTLFILAFLCLVGITIAAVYATRSRTVGSLSARTATFPEPAAEARLRAPRLGEELDDLRAQE